MPKVVVTAAVPPKKTLVFEATQNKETVGTFQMIEDGLREKHVSGSIYLKKGVLGGMIPKKVRVTVEIID